MNGSAPNFPATGFHSLLVRKPKPNALNESAELTARSMTRPTAITSKIAALEKSARRNIASLRLPVGESARRRVRELNGIDSFGAWDFNTHNFLFPRLQMRTALHSFENDK